MQRRLLCEEGRYENSAVINNMKEEDPRRTSIMNLERVDVEIIPEEFKLFSPG